MNDTTPDDEKHTDHSSPAEGPEAADPYGVGLGHAGSDGVRRRADLPAVEDAPAAQPLADVSPAIPQAELHRLTDEIVAALKSVYDPEIPVDIYELGLIYRIDVDDDYCVDVDMSLTAPGCPVAGEMPIWVQNAIEGVAGIKRAQVNLTFDPPWDPSRMSDEARFALDWW